MLASVSAEISEAKTLSASSPTAVTQYKYTATPGFALGSGETIHGAVPSMAPLSMSGSAASLGYFTPGKWTFAFQGLNSSGKVVTAASKDAYLKPGGNSALSVSMAVNEASGLGSGTLQLGIETNRLDASALPSVTVSILKAGASGSPAEQSLTWTTNASSHPSWYGDTAAVGTGRVFFTSSQLSVPPGAYIAVIELKDGSAVIAGQNIAFTSVSGGASYITGTLLPGQFALGSLTVTAPGKISGSLSASPASVAAGTEVTFTWTPGTGSAAADSWLWTNGMGSSQTTHTGTAKFTFASPGQYVVSAVASSSSIPDTAAAAVTVSVN